jgi:hypothetical protein
MDFRLNSARNFTRKKSGNTTFRSGQFPKGGRNPEIRQQIDQESSLIKDLRTFRVVSGSSSRGVISGQ